MKKKELKANGTIQARVPDETKKAIVKLARIKGVSPSCLVRMILKGFLQDKSTPIKLRG